MYDVVGDILSMLSHWTSTVVGVSSLLTTTDDRWRLVNTESQQMMANEWIFDFWCHQQDTNGATETRGRCVEIVFWSSLLFGCLFLRRLYNSRNRTKTQNPTSSSPEHINGSPIKSVHYYLCICTYNGQVHRGKVQKCYGDNKLGSDSSL